MEYMILIIGFLLGLIASIWYYAFIKTTDGVLKIDHTNPEKDLYLIEIEDLESLNNKREVILAIDNKADLSQK